MGIPQWARIIRLPIEKRHHFHYCVGCDDQWAHDGDSVECTKHWAAMCPECSTEVPGEQRRSA
jgi:hypothetical protein